MTKKISALQEMETFNDTKRKVLLSAVEIFSKDGFRYGSIRKIAENAGVNIAAINYHFGSKQKLYNFVVRYCLDLLFQDFPYDELSDKATPVRERFERFIHEAVGRVLMKREPSTFYQLFIREAVVEQTDVFYKEMQEASQPKTEILREMISEIAGGKLNDEALNFCTATTIGHYLFYSMIQNVVQPSFHLRLENEDEINQLADYIFRYSLGAIAFWNSDTP